MVIKHIGQNMLKSDPNILRSEQHRTTGKSSSWNSEGNFIVILHGDLYLFVPRKYIHKIYNSMSFSSINNLVYERG